MKQSKRVTKVAVGLMVVGAVLVLSQSGCTKAGPAGPQGAPGASVTGEQGPQGPTGQTGATGPAGADGENCTVTTLAVGSATAPNGGVEVSCPDGTTSVVGNGSSGSNGTNGANDSSCSVSTLSVGSVTAPDGGSLITCSDGSSSVVLNGSAGTAGADGAQGAAGAPGTVITPIQFCPGFKQSYPNTFSESAICVGGNLYGVYSLNGGFLAELPPGEYSSDGVNASCNFSIGPDCKVSN